MAKFKGGDLDLKTGQKVDFADAYHVIWMGYDDGELQISSTVSGVRAVELYHLVRYDQLTEVSGSLQNYIDNYEHGNLVGLLDDDHPQYVPRNGSRGFTSTVSGVPPVEPNDLVTKQYFLDSIDPTASGSIGNILFGDFYVFELENAESSTNSTTYQQKLRLNTDTLPSGVYRVGWHLEWRMSKANEMFYYRIQLDDTTTLAENFKSPVVDVNEWQQINNFYYLPALSSGVHYLDIDYRSSSTGATAYIQETRMEFWRVI